MARVDDRELYLDIEDATEEQLREGLIAARLFMARHDADVPRAMRAWTKMSKYVDQLMLWEQDEAEHPKEISEREWELGEIAEGAWIAALRAAGQPADGKPGTLGFNGVIEREELAPVVRNLFEPAE